MDLAILVLTTALAFILALFIYLKSSKSATNIYFSSILILLGLYSVFNYLSIHATTDDSAFFWAKAILYVSILVGPLFYFFVRTYPSTKFIFNKKLQMAMFAWVYINIILSYGELIFKDVRIINGSPQIEPGPAVFSFGLLQVISISSAIWTLIKNYKQTQKGLLKTHLKYIILGVVVSIGMTLLVTLILPLLFKVTLFIPNSPIFILIGTFAISYSILKHRLLDIRLVMARTVSYTIFIAISALAYSTLFTLISSYFLKSYTYTSEVTLTVVALGLFMAFTFQPIRKLLGKLTDRILYKDQYDSNKIINSFTHTITSTLSFEILTHKLLRELLSQMKIQHGMIIVFDETKVMRLTFEGYNKTPNISENEIHKILAESRMLLFDELDEGEIKSILRTYECSISLYLRNENRNLGLLLFGEKLSGETYSSDDINLLEIVASEAAIAIQNSLSYEQIKQFNTTLQDEIKKATENVKAVNEDMYKKNMELKKVTDELASANEKLKALDKLKDEFVSLASHELRTPMTAIKSYLWLFLQYNKAHLDGKERLYIERAYEATDRLIALVNDMLNVSRIESGRMTVAFKPLNLVQLTKEVLEELSPTAVKQKVELILDANADGLPNVTADQNKLREVLINLIGNSLKFTDPGGKVTIHIAKDNDMVVTDIIDTGKGIKEDDLPKLFQKFGIVGNNYMQKQNTQGTGLGLYISKSIIKLHGGDIWVKSDGENKGATFSFSLKMQGNELVDSQDGKTDVEVINSSLTTPQSSTL